MKRKAPKVAKKEEEEDKVIIPDPLKACIQKIYKRYKSTSSNLPKIKWNDGYENLEWGVPDETSFYATTFSVLSSITQGTTANERIGSSINNQFLILQIDSQQVNIIHNPVPPESSNIVQYDDVIPSGVKWKVSVVIDRQPKNDDIAVYNDIYNQVLNNKNVLRNMDNIERFDEVWQQQFVTNNTWAPSKFFEVDIPLHYLKSTYMSGVGAQTWPATNDVLIAVSAISNYGEDEDLDWPLETYLWEVNVSMAWRIFYTDG